MYLTTEEATADKIEFLCNRHFNDLGDAMSLCRFNFLNDKIGKISFTWGKFLTILFQSQTFGVSKSLFCFLLQTGTEPPTKS